MQKAVVHGINESGATHIVTSADLLKKLTHLAPKMPAVTHVLYMEDPLKRPFKLDVNGNESFKAIAFSAVEEEGHQLNKSGQRINSKPCAPDDIAVLMYTSGSTG